MIRVLIVDDQEVVTKGLQVILNMTKTIKVVGLAYNGAQALDLIQTTTPHLVLMDLNMPIMNGILATQAIRKQYPEVYVLVLTTYDADEWVFDALRAGAAGYLLKDAGGDRIVAAIEGTLEGHTHIDPGIADKLLFLARKQVEPNLSIFAELTPREITVLTFLARGLTNADIAKRLHLAEGTIRNIVSIILNKLAVEDRTQATALAWHHGLINTIH